MSHHNFCYRQVRFIKRNFYKIWLAYLVVTYPKCAVIPTFATSSCSSISSLTPSYGFSPSATCTSSGNSLTIRNVYADYGKSANTYLAFSISLSAKHTCTDADYVYVVAYENIQQRVIETAVVN